MGIMSSIVIPESLITFSEAGETRYWEYAAGSSGHFLNDSVMKFGYQSLLSNLTYKTQIQKI